jgi:predicted permease
MAVFRAVASLLPAGVRDGWLAEAERDLEETLRDRAARRGALAAWWAGAAATADLALRIPVEWWAARQGRRGPRGPLGGSGRGEWIMGWMNDLRVAARALARRPSFTAAAVLTLSLGIGATVAIFSVVNAVLLRPLPYPDADRIVAVMHHAPGWNFPDLANSPGTINFYRDEVSEVFPAFAGYRNGTRNLVTADQAARVPVVTVQPDMFTVLGIRPALGRPFGDPDGVPGAPSVAILMDGAWRTRFGADPGIVGRTVALDGEPTEVVGVMPPGFTFGDPDALALLPFPVDPNGPFGSFGIRAVGRLAPGLDLETAQRRVTELQSRLPDYFPDMGQDVLDQAGWSVTIERLQDDIVGEEVASALWVVLATVGFLLLIACANVANLFLVRAESRQKELAVRAAMGAGGGRIASGFLSEAALLGALGGIMGVLLAWGGVALLVLQGPSSLPRLAEVRLDGASIAFATAVSVVTSLAFGAIPMLRSRGEILAGILRDGGRASTAGRERHRTRGALVTAQLALALVLLVGSGLMLRTFARLSAVDPGFEPEDVVAVGMSVGEGRSTRDAAIFYQRVADEIRGLPGVAEVGLTQHVPVGGGSFNGSSFQIEGDPRPEDEAPVIGMYEVIDGGFLDAMGIPLVDGRNLTRADWEDDATVLVVNEAFAKLLGGDPVGKGIAFGGRDSTFFRIVGVVGDVHEEDLRKPVRPWSYMPMAQSALPIPLDGMTAMVRLSPGMAPPAQAIRDLVRRLDATVPVTTIRTMREVTSRSVAQTSFTMVLLGIAAGVALVLGAIGLFGVISYVVGQRTREIGVRVALGAASADIRGLVFRQSAVVAVAGVALGLVGARALTGMMGSILFGVSASDPVTFVGAPLLLLAVAVLATWLPARRASRIDPIEALVAE